MRKSFLRIITAFLSLQGCSQTSESVEPAGDTTINWQTPAVVANNTMYQTFYSNSAQARVSYHIFLPDEYVTEPEKRFKVLYWLHGSGGGNSGIPILTDYFNRAMHEKLMDPMIIVFPNGLPYGMWCNSKDGRQPVEDMFIFDLIPHIDSSYRTIATSNGRILEGFSMGGFGAMRLGIKHSHMFRAISSVAGGPFQETFTDVAEKNESLQIKIFKEVFSNDMDYFVEQSPRNIVQLYGPQVAPTFKIRQIIGTKDFSFGHNRDFHEYLISKNIAIRYYEFVGIGHEVIPLFTQMDTMQWEFYQQ